MPVPRMVSSPVTLVLCTLYGSSPHCTPYDRLCRIYEDVRGQPSSAELAMTVAKRVEREIPEIAEDCGLLANVDLGDRYDLLKALARDKAHQNDWQCEAIRKWYPPRAGR